ncbi:unnamed protein product [Ranitomeya imitator]|uniref:Cytochrome P450 n=1 Tax=Ranitomeya imitator TaxID=111125 RepID=A0ABN9KRL5_9NEOB|nr:unnamed protein product [Ranitomeya imitator]
MQNIQELKSFISQCSMNRRLEFDANDITGYIDAYLLKQEQESTKDQTYFNEENLVSSVLDLFIAGTETSSTTIRWGILLMMKYPEIQKRVQEEIKTHIKPGQLPTVEDRRKMPYTDAVIHEIQRFGNIVPLNLSHSTPSDVYLRGFLIPKGTEVIPFLTSVLYDKTQWKTPNDFNPNHFLDENGKFVRHDAFMPFSVGRRACAGEGLAKMELFLFFTGLLQAFTFYPPPGVSREDLSLKPAIGFTLELTKAETYFNEENLLSSVLDLFAGGTEGTSTTIRWGILLMMKYLEIQKKVQDEIKTYVKPGQLPRVEDRKKMPYTDAVIHEIQRFCNIVPLNVSHSTATDEYLRGYLIPKFSMTRPNGKHPMISIPITLDENGKFVKHNTFMPFSAGRRACAGESLAKLELFLFFTGLLQAFTFYPPPGVSREDLNLKPGVGFLLLPTPYMTCAKPNY